MAYEQRIQESMTQFEFDGGVSLKQKSKSISSPITDSESVNGCFECNICLDSAKDPVITLCGHLYCWPCIYKWLHVQSSSIESDEQPKCPVCKTNISQSLLVPLYGRGQSESDAKRPHLEPVIPSRPTACGAYALATSHSNQQQPQPFHHQQYFPHPYGNYAPVASSNLGSTTMAGVFRPTTMGMFGEMVLARMLGNSNIFPYAYPVVGNGSPRMRRQEMEMDKSLNRVTLFLFCCFVLCLLLF
ncbi:E3 ubiquitin-protein ligase RMA3-like [Actinidia eriantha]|uniref:E3 ubiquitin-protein ligase RMA3-like n=1 Tax=Actinidia eriantha TaxID=165200 RepID=UPI0025901246|nr:E3 ubiquitin-protein ligase RMA3-like [Actinidia eriantha]XP_057473126.1 E3 ubiquitin-protein ligase RMA3-like [Actinidia eriantha]